jgi:hypothetical protein
MFPCVYLWLLVFALNKEHNSKQTGFLYSQDMISVTTNGDELLLVNEKSKQEFSMKAKFTPK